MILDLPSKDVKSPITITSRTRWSALFSDEVLKESKNLIDYYSKTKKYIETQREDLTEIRTFVIDDADSEENDDAISVEKVNNEISLWIHIADPASLISQDSLIDQEARTRATSLYLPEKSITMLPHDLVTKVLNLKQGRVTPALSFNVILTDEGEIRRSRICQSLIKPTYSLSYEEADELIELSPSEDWQLAKLSKVLTNRSNLRHKNGSISIEQTEGRFKSSDNKITIRFITPTPSRKLISEAMILLGHIAAKYALNNKIPLIYRSQAQKYRRNNGSFDQSLNETRVNNLLLMEGFSRALYSTKANEHYSLGLECYAHLSSPIRRYIDLINHRQIIGHLRSNQIYNTIELEDLIKQVDIRINEANKLTRSSNRHCLVKWFQTRDDSVVEAVFLKWLNKSNKVALVYIASLEMNISMILEQADSINIGQHLKLKLTRSCLADQSLHFTVKKS